MKYNGNNIGQISLNCQQCELYVSSGSEFFKSSITSACWPPKEGEPPETSKLVGMKFNQLAHLAPEQDWTNERLFDANPVRLQSIAVVSL